MTGVNKAILVGHLGADPEIRRTQDGRPVATFNVATSQTWRDKATGERRESTDWHRVVIFNEALVKVAEQYLKKGAKVYVEGQIKTRKWQHQDGSDRYSTEIVLSAFNAALVMLDRAERAPPPAEESYGNRRDAPPPATPPSRRDDMDDEISF